MARALTPYERLEAFLRIFTYKPGWELKAERRWIESFPPGGREEQVFLQVTFDAPDVSNPARAIRVGKRCVLPYHILLEESSVLGPYGMLTLWVMSMIREIEMHEVDEWARLDGVCIKDPHPKPGVYPLADSKLAR